MKKEYTETWINEDSNIFTKAWKNKMLFSSFAKEDTRFVFNGIYFGETKDEKQCQVATNGRVLFLLQKKYNEKMKGIILVPATLESIDGNYPDYEQVIPKTQGNEIEVNIPEWVKTIKLKGDGIYLCKVKEKYTISTDDLDSDSVKINPEYLKLFAGFESVKMITMGSMEPVRVIGEDWKYIIMPMKKNN